MYSDMETKMITSYEQLPIGAYARIMAALEDTALSDNEKHLALIGVLTGLTRDELLDEPLEVFREQTAAAGFVLVYPQAHKVQDAYTLRGVRYLPTIKERKMTAGQFIDWNEIAGTDGDTPEKWARLLSVVLVPEGHTYGNGYDIAEVQEAIGAELCVLDAVALRAFFFALCELSVTDTLPYLERAMRKMNASGSNRRKTRKMMREAARSFRLAGAGWQTLTRWLKLPESAGVLLPTSQP